MASSETNKVGFTTEQQEMLAHALSLATAGANIMTYMHSPGIPAADAEKELQALDMQCRANYPKGPLQLAEELREIARFCDLPTIYIATRDGEAL